MIKRGYKSAYGGKIFLDCFSCNGPMFNPQLHQTNVGSDIFFQGDKTKRTDAPPISTERAHISPVDTLPDLLVRNPSVWFTTERDVLSFIAGDALESIAARNQKTAEYVLKSFYKFRRCVMDRLSIEVTRGRSTLSDFRDDAQWWRDELLVINQLARVRNSIFPLKLSPLDEYALQELVSAKKVLDPFLKLCDLDCAARSRTLSAAQTDCLEHGYREALRIYGIVAPHRSLLIDLYLNPTLWLAAREAISRALYAASATCGILPDLPDLNAVHLPVICTGSTTLWREGVEAVTAARGASLGEAVQILGISHAHFLTRLKRLLAYIFDRFPALHPFDPDIAYVFKEPATILVAIERIAAFHQAYDDSCVLEARPAKPEPVDASTPPAEPPFIDDRDRLVLGAITSGRRSSTGVGVVG